MYIWPDGSTTGSVNQQVLDEYRAAKEAGEDLSRFAPFLAENSAEVAAGAGAREFQPQPAPTVEEQQETAAKALASYQQERGLPQTESPEVPVTVEPQEAPQPDTAPDETQVPEEPQQAPEAPAGDDYDTLSKESLQDQLSARGLPTSGNKPELVDRLRTADAGG